MAMVGAAAAAEHGELPHDGGCCGTDHRHVEQICPCTCAAEEREAA